MGGKSDNHFIGGIWSYETRKKYVESAKLVDKPNCTTQTKRLPLQLKQQRQSSTKPLKSTSVWALTPVTLTNRSEARLSCRTAPVKSSRCGLRKGADADAAQAAGAEIVGAEDLVQQVQGGMMDFDVCIAAQT